MGPARTKAEASIAAGSAIARGIAGRVQVVMRPCARGVCGLANAYVNAVAAGIGAVGQRECRGGEVEEAARQLVVAAAGGGRSPKGVSRKQGVSAFVSHGKGHARPRRRRGCEHKSTNSIAGCPPSPPHPWAQANNTHLMSNGLTPLSPEVRLMAGGRPRNSFKAMASVSGVPSAALNTRRAQLTVSRM